MSPDDTNTINAGNRGGKGMTVANRSLPRAAAIAIAVFVLVAGAIGAGTASAAKHHHGKTHHPAGAVKLPKSKLRHVKGTVCGQLGKKWVPGSIVGGYFISDSKQAHNYAILAKHSKGKAKGKAKATSKKFAKRAKARSKACAAAGGGRGGNHGTPGGGGGAPLRFNLQDAVGLALKGTSPGGTTSNLQTQAMGPRATASSSPSEETGSNLETVGASGQVSDAVTSGTAKIEKFLVGPDGKLYVIFATGGVNLENSGGSSTTGEQRCILAQVDPATGIPTCIDSSMTQIFTNVSSSAGGPINPPVQFDASGAIYYAGSTNGGGLALRKWSNGTTKDLVAPSGISIREFLVMPDGTVFITGITQSNNTQWTRRIAPDGSLHSVLGTMVYFMARYPDSKAYFGIFQIGGPFGVDSYDAATEGLASQWWIADSEAVGPPSGGEVNDTKSICGSSSSVSFTVRSNFCPGGSYISQSITTAEGKVFAFPDGQGTPIAMQYYPTVAIVPTAVSRVSVAAAKGNDLLLAGTDSSGDQILTEYDPASEAETQLLGPPTTADQYEIFHMSYLEEGNKILFDGQRFSDNQYVIGEYDLATHTVNVVASSTAKWQDLQGL
jgi:hypothetical protein